MANGESFLSRMHPADLAELKESLRPDRANAPVLPAQPISGVDATVIQRIMREEIDRSRRDKSGPDEKDLRRIVAEVIEKDHQRNREEYRRLIREEADRVLEERLPKVFRDLDMSIDPDDINNTRKKLGRLFDWQEAAHEWKGNFFHTLVKALGLWIAGILSAGLGFLFLRGGQTH